jgi:bifunctional non-homologous end joining protein LigD
VAETLARGHAPKRRPSTTTPSRTARARGSSTSTPSGAQIDALVRTFDELEDARQDATIDLGNGQTIAVTNLHKPFWPSLKLTKGDLFRYYVQVAPALLPAIADRTLVMKRYPNGVDAEPFYQHSATHVPPGVRVERVGNSAERPTAAAKTAVNRTHIIGGDLLTLLYTTQLAAISQDPWFSRIQSQHDADFVALDLDPSPGVSFRQVLEVARAIHDELESLGTIGVPKTSGSSGLHIYVPLPSGTPYEAGLLFCQIIATVVAHKHPRVATVERAVNARGRRVYVDYLQNVLGKTLASAYSARASAYAGVSTPLTWAEIEAGVDREDFTLRSVPARLATVGDLWATLRESKGVDLARAAKYGL